MGLVLVAAMTAFLGATHLSAARLDSEAVLFTAAPSYLPLAWTSGGERFPRGASIYYRDGKGTRKLFPDFAQSADANISFDGTRLLFSGKKLKSDPWQIWEASFADLVPRQVTHTSDDAIRPFYLPDDRIVYSAKQNGTFVLVNASLDGSGQQQISFAATNIVATDVLRDGRILLNAAYSGQNESSPEIFAVFSDGSGFESIRCDHEPVRFAGRESSTGDIVFTHGSNLGMFSSPLASEKKVGLPPADYAGDVVETTSHDWIVATRTTGSGVFALRLWKPNGGPTTPYASIPSQNLVQPQVRTVRPVPKKHLLGSSPVEADGSFFVRVPGDTPIKFELADSHGNTLQREKGWFWARSGEQRICVGCHAGPEHAPENAVPMVLERSTVPIDMTKILSSQTGGH